MSSEELKNIIDTFNEQGKMDFLKAATDEQITNFEKENQVVLPEGYKEWLRFSDSGESFLPEGVQLYGVAHKPLLDVNDNDRTSNKYIVMDALVPGTPIMCEKDSEQISIYNHEVGRIEKDETCVDFCAFFKELYDLLGIGE